MDRPQLKAVHFNFGYDTDEPTYAGFTDGSHWNGFTNIWCTPEVRDQIAAFFKKHGQEQQYYDEFKALPTGEDGLIDLSGGYATIERDARGYTV